MRQHASLARAALAAIGLLAAAEGAAAQSFSVTPMVGVYVPAGDVDALGDDLQQFDTERERGLAYGLNVEASFLRGTVRYVSDAVVSRDGVTDGGSGAAGFDGGNLLTAALDVVLRPVPRLLGLQPYVLGGVGLKRHDYDFASDGTDAFPSSASNAALHVGLGADFKLGALAMVVEVDDAITRVDGALGQHDAFAMVGLRLGF